MTVTWNSIVENNYCTSWVIGQGAKEHANGIIEFNFQIRCGVFSFSFPVSWVLLCNKCTLTSHAFYICLVVRQLHGPAWSIVIWCWRPTTIHKEKRNREIIWRTYIQKLESRHAFWHIRAVLKNVHYFQFFQEIFIKLSITIYTYIPNWPLQPFSQNFGLASHHSCCVC